MDYISIDNFEGPLDLLLHLVKESNIDICDIKIDEITEKYLDYIRKQDELNINVSSSYLVMASELMYIKSKSLLPKVKNDNDEEVDEELTPTFKKLEEDRKNIYIKSPEKVSEYTDNHEYGVLSSNDLLEAFKKFLERKEKEKPLNTTVTNKEYSVRDRKKSIRNILHNKRKAYLEEFIEEYNRPYLVVTFLGILEMVKEKEVIIKQDKNFDKILVELR